jgi:hypothetical protein
MLLATTRQKLLAEVYARTRRREQRGVCQEVPTRVVEAPPSGSTRTGVRELVHDLTRRKP